MEIYYKEFLNKRDYINHIKSEIRMINDNLIGFGYNPLTIKETKLILKLAKSKYDILC